MRSMGKVKGKAFIKVLSVFVFILFVLVSLTAPLFSFAADVLAEGSGSQGEATLSKSGKITMTLTIDKDNLESYLLDADSFKTYVDNTINVINTSSQDTDMVTLKGVKDCGGTYEVSVKTRRINSNLRGIGDFERTELSKFAAEESDTYLRLMNMQNGNLRATLRKPFDGVLGSVEIEAGTSKHQVYIKPVDAATGEEMTVEQLAEEAAKASNKTYAEMFRIPDVHGIAKITIKLPGKVKYVSSGCVNVVDEKTIELVPVTLKANLTRYVYQLDDDGNIQYDQSGVALMTPVSEKDQDINCFFGYFAYEEAPNYVMIGCLTALGIGLIALIIVAYYKGWFHKFFGVERKTKQKAGATNKTLSSAAQTNGNVSAESVSIMEKSAAVGSDALAATIPQERTDEESILAEKLRKKNLWLKSPFARIMKHKLLYLMLVPSLILIIIFCYIPMFGIVIAFKDYNLIDGVFASEWVGFKYFKDIFAGTDPNVFLVFRNTIYISIIRVATNFPAILIFALMINEIKSDKLKGLTRTISYLPSFISWIAVGGMAISLFSVDEGILNLMFTRLSGHTVRINWYAENKYWWMILALSSMWKSLGWGTIIYMSALGCINSELYDACRIDGGGRFRMIISVTIPGIMNVIMLQLIMDAGNLMHDNYEQILAMTQGSGVLSESTYVVGAMTYSSIMSGSGYSTATAFGLIQGAVGLMLVLLTNRIVKKTDNEGVI